MALHGLARGVVVPSWSHPPPPEPPAKGSAQTRAGTGRNGARRGATADGPTALHRGAVSAVLRGVGIPQPAGLRGLSGDESCFHGLVEMVAPVRHSLRSNRWTRPSRPRPPATGTSDEDPDPRPPEHAGAGGSDSASRRGRLATEAGASYGARDSRCSSRAGVHTVGPATRGSTRKQRRAECSIGDAADRFVRSPAQPTSM
jgi:hypothetical protein